jgi:UDP-N-acetylmuramoyl-L-alanyl-D-glutamate--2,6-diaminopimelate ligase
MGKIASKLADQVFVTSDNPRSEKPEAIILDILNGIESKRKAVAVVDRKLAIQSALEEARPGDTVVIAGKGHETYQQVGSEKIPFDDAAVAESALHSLGVWKG